MVHESQAGSSSISNLPPNILHSVLLGLLGNGDVFLHGHEAAMPGDAHDKIRTLAAFGRQGF